MEDAKIHRRNSECETGATGSPLSVKAKKERQFFINNCLNIYYIKWYIKAYNSKEKFVVLDSYQIFLEKETNAEYFSKTLTLWSPETIVYFI